MRAWPVARSIFDVREANEGTTSWINFGYFFGEISVLMEHSADACLSQAGEADLSQVQSRSLDAARVSERFFIT